MPSSSRRWEVREVEALLETLALAEDLGAANDTILVTKAEVQLIETVCEWALDKLATQQLQTKKYQVKQKLVRKTLRALVTPDEFDELDALAELEINKDT